MIGAMGSAPLHVACLCAAWCTTCEAYRSVFDSVATEAEFGAIEWHWVDIEDDEELVGNLDVETFPTLIVFDRARVLFSGPLMPHGHTLRRLLLAHLAEGTPGPAVAPDPDVEALVSRLLRRGGV